MNARKKYWGSRKDKDFPSFDEFKDEPFIMKEPSVVESINNHIYFYSEIERDHILILNKTIREKACDLSSSAIEEQRDPSKIYLYINSYGGDVFSGLSSLDEIINCKVPVYTCVDGCCASAATFLSVVGKKRLIKKHSMMLIHQLSSGFWGKYSEIQDEMENMNLLMETIKRIYREFTKIPEAELEKILKHDLYFDAKKCLEYGLVDEII